MSWSNRWLGKRSGIKAAMERYSATLSGNSKEEFDAARPHIEALIDMNHNGKGDPVIDVDANGHAYRAPVESESYSQVSVTIRQVGQLCE